MRVTAQSLSIPAGALRAIQSLDIGRMEVTIQHSKRGRLLAGCCEVVNAKNPNLPNLRRDG